MVTNCKNGGGYFLRNTNKRKGFTLIELLAVIVILSVIAVIATPIILNIVNDARKSAVKDSILGYIEAIENEVALSSLDDKDYKDNEEYGYDEIKVNIKGIRPTGGLYTLKEGLVTNGTFCIDGYTVNYENNEVEVENKGCSVEDLKLNGSIKLSSNSGNYTYPETKEIEVIENISGGTLSCQTSDSSVATCEVSGNKIIVKSGTKEESATLTIKSSSTSKYKEASAAYVAVTANGLLSVTANGYNGIYDTKEHGITVKVENAIIKYGEEEGTYNLEESPKYTDVGEYTVYYEITKAGYKTVRGSKNVVITKAEGEIELEETTGTVAYKEIKEVEIVKNISNGEIEVEIANPELVEVIIENNKIVIKGKEKGTTTITVTSKETHNYNSVNTQYQVEVIKANNTLKLSSNSGNYTYPSSGTIEVIENISGGTLSCATNNSSVATCSISGNIITVKPGTTEGSATLTIKSASTANYNEAQVAYVAITAKGTLTSYTANSYTGVYDGNSHGITVESSGATITYGTSSGTYTETTSPKYTDVGEYTVYFKIEKEGYNDIESSKKVVITKAEGSVIAPTAKTLTYNGNSQTLINVGSTTTGTIVYKLGSTGTYSEELPSATNAGTYTVYYKVIGDSNHNDVKEQSISVTINKATLNYTSGGYSGAYDSNAHGITVISEGATIKYGEEEGTYNLDASPILTDVGTKTVYFKITRDNYIDVTGSEKIEITKINNTLTLSENTKTYTYPESGTFTVTTNTSGGTLSCSTNNSSVATCSISGTTVTVTPGTTEGTANITVTSESTTNYNSATVTHLATTASGTLSVTANGYDGSYDGAAHGITVTASGATIKYGTSSGSYTLTSSPTYTNVGTYTVYYQVTKAGYKTVTGSKNIIITKANNTLILSENSGSYIYPNSGTFTVTKNTSGGTLSCETSNSAVATCSISGTTVTVTPGTIAGNVTLTITSSATSNYNSKQVTYTAMSVAIAQNVVNGTTTYYTNLQSALDSSTTGTTTLIRNTTEDIRISNPSINKILNLNGSILNGYLWIQNDSTTLKINGPGTIKHTSNRALINSGIMLIENVNIYGGKNYEAAILNQYNGQINLTDCTIHSEGTSYLIANQSTKLMNLWRVAEAQISGTLPILGKVIMFKDFNLTNPIVPGDYEFSIYGMDVTTCPTWSEYNGQDDLVWHSVGTYTNGTGTYSYCRFNKSNHNNETGVYYTHIYNNSTFVAGYEYTVN